jgi:hypothetical protein
MDYSSPDREDVIKRRETSTMSPSRSLFGSTFESPSRSLLPKKNNAVTPETVPCEEDYFEQSESSSASDIHSIEKAAKHEVTVYVDDYQPWTFQSLVETLAANTVLTKVGVYRLRETSNSRMRNLSEMAFFFAAIRGLPHLNELILCNFNESDLDLISSFVNHHPTLEKLHLHFTSGTVDVALLDILAEAPALKELSLEVQQAFSLSILLLAPSNTLTHLSVPTTSFKFDEKQSVAAMQALEQNETLISLDLKPKLSVLGIRGLSYGIEDNKRLESLKFSFTTEDEEDVGKGLLDLAHAASRNSSLKVVQNYQSKSVQVEKTDVLRTSTTQRLELNETEEEFSVFGSSHRINNNTNDENLLEDNSSGSDCNAGLPFSTEWMCGDFHLWRPNGIQLVTAGTEMASFLHSRLSSASLKTQGLQTQPMLSQVQEGLRRTWSRWSTEK